MLLLWLGFVVVWVIVFFFNDLFILICLEEKMLEVLKKCIW